MNNSQKQTILNEIEKFSKSDFEASFRKKYKEANSLDDIVAEDYTVTEIISLAKRAILQLEQRLNAPDWQILFNSLALPGYGQFTLNANISSITTQLLAGAYQNAIKHIKTLVYFEMISGFWYLPNKENKKAFDKTIGQLTEKANLTLEYAEERKDYVNELVNEIESIKSELNDFKKEKSTEFTTLSNNQNESNTILGNIKKAQDQIDNINKTITSANKKCEDLLAALNSAQENAKKQQDTIDERNQESQTLLAQINTDLKNEADSVKSTHDYVNEQKKAVAEMMGYIGDGTLSHSFNRRKQSIQKSMYWCLGISVFFFIAMIVWILCVFLCPVLTAKTDNVWANILINSIKSSPLVFAFFYVLNEYKKERILLEEYAFRESVAVTLTAYLEQLTKQDNDDKVKLLMSTVEKLYTKPVIKCKEDVSLMKDIKEALSEVKDIVKGVKS